MFYTEQQLLAQIKGWEYIIAIAFLGLFILFWWMLGRERKQRRLAREMRGSFRPRQEQATQAKAKALGRGQQPRKLHCWQARSCPAEIRQRCPGYMLSPLPCWIARGLVEGKRWEPCATCPVYAQEMGRLVQSLSNRAKGGTFPEAPAA